MGVYDGEGLNGVATGRRGIQGIGSGDDEFFFISEVGRYYEEGWNGLPGRVSFGAAHHTARVETPDGSEEDGLEAFFFTWDQALRRSGDQDGVGDLDGFLQIGYTSDELSEIWGHIGTGVTWTGPTEARPNDIVGFGGTLALISDDAGLDESNEFALETFWRLEATQYLSLKPNLPYIFNPGASGDLDDALVFTIRAELSF